MQNKLTVWWQTLSARERQLVSLLAGFVVLFTVTMGIIKPIQTYASRAEQQLATQRSLQQWVMTTSAEIEALRVQHGTGVRSIPINNAIAQSAQRYNIELSRIENRDEDVQVWLAPLPFDQLTRWLDTLKAQYGITASALDIERDQTSGVVQVRRLALRQE